MFKIGEFARIAQISAKILRHYDAIELFTPAHIDEHNGYRYYTIEQLAMLNRIIVLKELGFSLAQVKELISNDLPMSEMRGMFTMRKAQVEQSIEADIQRLAHIQSRLTQIEQAGVLDQSVEVVVKDIPAQSILSIQQHATDFQDAQIIFRDFITMLTPVLSTNHTNPLVLITHTPDDEFSYGEPFIFELGLVLNATPSGSASRLMFRDKSLEQRELPSVSQMATVLQSGHAAHFVTGAFGEWLTKNDYQMCGQWREIYHKTSLQPVDFIIEHHVPIRKKGA